MTQTLNPNPRIVIIEVNGGVAECTSKPDDVQVRIVDWDNLNYDGIECPE